MNVSCQKFTLGAEFIDISLFLLKSLDAVNSLFSGLLIKGI